MGLSEVGSVKQYQSRGRYVDPNLRHKSGTRTVGVPFLWRIFGATIWPLFLALPFSGGLKHLFRVPAARSFPSGLLLHPYSPSAVYPSRFFPFLALSLGPLLPPFLPHRSSPLPTPPLALLPRCLSTPYVPYTPSLPSPGVTAVTSSLQVWRCGRKSSSTTGERVVTCCSKLI